MTSEQGILTIMGELRSVVADLQAQNKDLQAKLDALERENKALAESITPNNIRIVEKNKVENE